MAAAVAVAAAAIGVAWYLGSDGDAPLPNSIAVLPFENLSPDPANAFFAAGLHGEILSQLAKIAALNVIGQTSMRGFAESPRTPREIAAELNVETVLHAMDRRGSTVASLWCLEENHRARRLYEYLGWRPQPDRRPASWPPHPIEMRYTKLIVQSDR